MATIAPIHYLCVFGMGENWRLERRLRRAGINSDWVRVWSSWPREIGEIIPNPNFRLIFTSVFLGFSPPSYSFINATVRIPGNARSHCDEELHRNLSDMRRSTFQIGAASIESGKIAWINDEILVLINMDKNFLCCFKGTSLDVENWFERVFVLLTHLAAKRPVTRLWVTTMVLFENIIE